jgi:CubicO group peptidase (beta-lactamase class C family)
MVLSVSKGIVAIAAHMLAQEGRLDFDAPVVKYWPEFAAEGKDRIPVRWLFSHQAGLPAIDPPQLATEDVYAWTPVVNALAAQRPWWDPGTAHGYHAGTYGWLAGEVIRRIAGMSVGTLIAERIARPLEAEFFIGLPDELNSRVAPILRPLPAPPGTPPDAVAARLADPSTLAHKAFSNPVLLGAINEQRFWAAEVPAANGIGTARALSRIYAACIGQVDGVRLLDAKTLDHATRTQAHGDDLVMGYETHYGTGFQLPFPFRPMAGPGSFGHYGMGGSVAFAHPAHGLSFAYVMNQMLPSARVDPRPAALVDALKRCLR